jgi:hypothetical protein
MGRVGRETQGGVYLKRKQGGRIINFLWFENSSCDSVGLRTLHANNFGLRTLAADSVLRDLGSESRRRTKNDHSDSETEEKDALLEYAEKYC